MAHSQSLSRSACDRGDRQVPGESVVERLLSFIEKVPRVRKRVITLSQGQSVAGVRYVGETLAFIET
jgi:hypothetical protein